MATRLRLRTDAVDWRLVEGEVIALDLAGSTYLSANASGAALWELLSRGATEDELAAALTDRFDVDADQAQGDVSAFLEMLASHQLLVREP